MKLSGIYKIQSIIKPDRCYVGSAMNIQKRWWLHLCNLRKGKHHSRKLQNHYNKYGEADLSFSVLIGCEKELLIAYEQFFIDAYKPFFNCKPTAGSNLGFKVSEETKLKLSLKNKGQIPWCKGKKLPPYSDERKKQLSESHLGQKAWNKGKKMDEDYCKRMSEIQRGRIPWNKGKKTGLYPKNTFQKGTIPWNKGKKLAPFSEEVKQKMSIAHKGVNTWMKGRHLSEETKLKQSKALKGRKMSDESKLRMSLAQKGNKKWLGKNHSEETKQKLRELGKKDWELRRAKKEKQLLLQTSLN